MIVLVIGILVIAILADLSTHRIPNALIILGILIGLITSFINTGLEGLVKALVNAVIVLILFYLLYLIYALGAGDVKLLVVIALYLGVVNTIKILAISSIIFVIFGLAKFGISWINSKLKNINIKRKEKLKNKIDLMIIRLTCNCKSAIENKLCNGKLTRIPFSPFILLATIIVWRIWL